MAPGSAVILLLQEAAADVAHHSAALARAQAVLSQDRHRGRERRQRGAVVAHAAVDLAEQHARRRAAGRGGVPLVRKLGCPPRVLRLHVPLPACCTTQRTARLSLLCCPVMS